MPLVRTLAYSVWQIQVHISHRQGIRPHGVPRIRVQWVIYESGSYSSILSMADRRTHPAPIPYTRTQVSLRGFGLRARHAKALALTARGLKNCTTLDLGENRIGHRGVMPQPQSCNHLS